MSTSLERSRRRRFAPGIAMAAGIFVLLVGLYFIFGISGNTDKDIEKCTEELAGIVTESVQQGNDYQTTIEYTPGYSPMTVTYLTKEEYPVGTELKVMMEPQHFSHIYIEGISEKGSDNKMQGLIMAVCGIVLTALGAILAKQKKGKRSAW